MDRYLLKLDLGTKDQPQFLKVYHSEQVSVSIVLTDNLLCPYLQYQIHVHVLGTGNHIIWIKNSQCMSTIP